MVAVTPTPNQYNSETISTYYYYDDDLHSTASDGISFVSNSDRYITQSYTVASNFISPSISDAPTVRTQVWNRNKYIYDTVITQYAYDVWAEKTTPSITTRDRIGELLTPIAERIQHDLVCNVDYASYYGYRFIGDPNSSIDIYRGDSDIIFSDPEEAKIREAAEEKAKKLLAMIIGDEQLKIYEKTGRMLVRGKSGTKYIVRKGRTVQKIGNDKIIDLCVHIKTSFNCPKTDNVIALKFLLEDQEDYILSIANNLGSESLPKELPLAACM